MDVTKEYIVCSAIWYVDKMQLHDHQPKNVAHGYVVCGLRHHNCIMTNYLLSGRPTFGNESVSGFLTSEDRFVDRKQALEIALSQNQIVKKSGNPDSPELFSEDIY